MSFYKLVPQVLLLGQRDGYGVLGRCLASRGLRR